MSEIHAPTGAQTLGWSAPSAASTRRKRIAVALVALNVVDVVLTRLILDRGGAEANPIMTGLMEGLAAPLGLKFAIASLAAVLLLCCPPGAKLGERTAIAVLGYYVLVTVWNVVLFGILLFG